MCVIINHDVHCTYTTYYQKLNVQFSLFEKVSSNGLRKSQIEKGMYYCIKMMKLNEIGSM